MAYAPIYTYLSAWMVYTNKSTIADTSSITIEQELNNKVLLGKAGHTVYT